MVTVPNLEVSSLIAPAMKAFRALGSEWNNLLEIGLSDYLYAQTEKYYFTNTFLHRSEKVKFKDIYFPISATYDTTTSTFDDVDEVFKNFRNITIVGSAGSGKTTLIKHIFLQTIYNSMKIPILVELRNLNDYDGDLEKLITEKILRTEAQPSIAIFKRTLKSGKFLFLLDGYDEIFSDRKQELNRQIEIFVDSYSRNSFIITTRPGSGIENFPGSISQTV